MSSRFPVIQQQLFYGPLSSTTRVSQYQKKHSPTHHLDHRPVFISFFHLRSIASSLFKLCAWQSFCTTFLHILFGLPLGLEPPPHIPYISSPNQCLLFATLAHTIATCFAVIARLYHLPSFSLNSLLGSWNSIFYLNITHPSDHSHLCSLYCQRRHSLTQISVPSSHIHLAGRPSADDCQSKMHQI